MDKSIQWFVTGKISTKDALQIGLECAKDLLSDAPARMVSEIAVRVNAIEAAISSLDALPSTAQSEALSQAFEDGKRYAHEQALLVAHELIKERDEWKVIAQRAASQKDSERDAAIRKALDYLHAGMAMTAQITLQSAVNAMASQQGGKGECSKCGDVLPPGTYCKGIGCPLNPALKGGA